MDRRVNAFLAFAKMIKPGWRANLIFSLFYYPLKLIAPRSKVAAENIALAFPNESVERRAEMLAESYRSMVWTGVEMLAWQRDPSLLDTWVVEVEGREHIERAFGLGKGVIMVSAHVGNWEHTAAWLGRNYGCVGIARHADSPFQRELISTLRASTGLKILGKEESMKRAVSILKNNGMLGLLSDQHGGDEGIQAPLLGQTTSTVTGAAVFAWLTGAQIISFQSLRLEPFKFRIIITPPIEWERGPDRDSSVRSLTEKVNGEIEKIILRAPGEWLWQHRRFKETISG